MPKFSHFILITLCGFIWFMVGTMLMSIGVHHLMDAMNAYSGSSLEANVPVLQAFSTYLSPQQAMVALILTAISMGYLKGYFVLSRSVKRGVDRILTYPNPTGLQNIYEKKYYLLLFVMMGFGMILKRLHLPHDLHGAIDLAIGCALLQGSFLYFKLAWTERKRSLA